MLPLVKRLLLPLLFGIAGCAILLSLGVWQVQRLAWKEGILAQIEARIAAEPAALPDAPEVSADQYAPVAAEGVIGAEALRVLVSQKRIGAGYRLVSPFETEGGRRILLDRGFIRIDADAPPPPAGTVQVTGNLLWPDEISEATPPADEARNIWFARDLPKMAAALGTEPVLLVARRLDPAEPAVAPLPVGTAQIPNDHLQYAITWFSLAAIWAGMTLWYIRHQHQAGRRKT